MREAAERALSEWPRFESVVGSAEDTTLRPRGVIAWVWNSRRTAGSAFAEALERFLERWGTDHISVRDTYRVREQADKRS